MRCRNLDHGSIPNRDPFARFWRDAISQFADLLPKADGLANGDEGFYDPFPYQGNYIKSLRRLDTDFGDDPNPGAYCDYLGVLQRGRLRLSNDFDDIDLQGDETQPKGVDCRQLRNPRKLTNPQGGLPVSIEGPDSSGVNLNLFRNSVRSLRPAPRINGSTPLGGVTREHEIVAEMVELYWMALLRDLPFRRWSTGEGFVSPPQEWRDLETDGATISNALSDLNQVKDYFAEAYPTVGGEVTAATIFRGSAYGDQFGPYLSQFLLRGNTVRCARNRQIRHLPREGVIPEGANPNLQRQATVQPYVDFLRRKDEWRCVEQGYTDPTGSDPIECFEVVDRDGRNRKVGRFIRSLRDLANHVHVDDPAQHFRNAALLLMNEPELSGPMVQGAKDEAERIAGLSGRSPLDSYPFETHKDDLSCTPTGRPFRLDECNPYISGSDGKNQTGFVTFSPQTVLDALHEVTDLALRAAWWQKWFVHRRLRPEEFGGLVDGWLREKRAYAVDPLLQQFDLLLRLILRRNSFTDDDGGGGSVGGSETYLLPQVFPEGCPTHPSYPSGHATISGACATILKAFFDEERWMTCPDSDGTDPAVLPPAFVAADDGLELEVAAENSQPLTVGGEIDKLASNISIGRNAAGVHWRSDATQGMELGEAVAAYYLYEQAWSLNEETFCFSFRRLFQNERVTIRRTTEYGSGQEIRRVSWMIEPIDEKGRSLEPVASGERSRVEPCH